MQRWSSLVGLENQRPINEAQLYVAIQEDMLNPPRFYLSKCDSLEVFKSGLNKSFPNLYFHSRVETTIVHFKDIQKHANELIRHLSVLNDFLPELYTEFHQNHQEIYSRLKSEYSIICSGLGSTQKSTTFELYFENTLGNKVPIKCVPHTKLYTEYSDDRIYFFWGQNDIQYGKVLVGHIGRHWK